MLGAWVTVALRVWAEPDLEQTGRAVDAVADVEVVASVAASSPFHRAPGQGLAYDGVAGVVEVDLDDGAVDGGQGVLALTQRGDVAGNAERQWRGCGSLLSLAPRWRWPGPGRCRQEGWR